MRLLRTQGATGQALRALRQAGGPIPARDLDELADTLVAFIVANHADETKVSAVSAARMTLGMAGIAHGAGTPYAGTGVRLLRIAEQVHPSYTGGTIYYLARIADRQEAVRLLTHLAQSPSASALGAIRTMLSDLGPEGIAALQGMYARDETRNREARRLLRAVAAERGWEDGIRP